MDLSALATLNALLGNDARAAGIEWALAGGEVKFERSATFALGGAVATALSDGASVEPFRAYRAKEGSVLSVEALTEGRFLYLAFAGGIECELVMRSRSTYLPGAFGGLQGRRLKSGDQIELAKPRARRRHQVSDPLPESLRSPFRVDAFRYIPRDGGLPGTDGGPTAGRYTISSASDRTGYRLEGSPLPGGASVTSEPVCPGVIQLPPGGEPIVLMADAPTIGGYRIVGTIISADLGALAQRMPGDEVTLVATTVEQAQREMEARAEVEARVREWSLS